MISLLAPSKTMNFTPMAQAVTPSTPYFYAEASQIVEAIKQSDDLVAIVRASDAIVQKTKLAYEHWGDYTNPSIFAYVGDVYKGFFAPTLQPDDICWAQEHLIILSGLYGALRPLDQISAYRLEMKAKVRVNGSKDLYDFWGDRVARLVDERANGIICVLSSDEYAKVVTAHTASRIVTPVFLDKKPNGTIGTVPIYSKMMRGVMARWIIDNRVDTPEQLKAFSRYGYSYDAGSSTIDRPAFYRDIMTPLRFT